MLKKKSHPKFSVPNFGAKSRSRVKERWRKQRGVDNKKRIKKSFTGAEPTIGYRNPEQLRGTRRSGRKPVLVRSAKELNDIIADAKTDTSKIDIVLAHSLSKRSRSAMLKTALKNKINVSNVREIAKETNTSATKDAKASSATKEASTKV